MVSGRAVESPFSEGAEGGPTDYIRKEKLARLVPAIRRALAKAETRKH